VSFYAQPGLTTRKSTTSWTHGYWNAVRFGGAEKVGPRCRTSQIKKGLFQTQKGHEAKNRKPDIKKTRTVNT